MDDQLTLNVPCCALSHIRRPRKPRSWGWLRFGVFTSSAALLMLALAASPVEAAKPAGGSSSRSARDEAVQLIPHDQLSPEQQEKVASVLSQVSIFRRLPTQVIECDPKLYLFLVEHPELVVNMWEVMDVSDMRLEKSGPDTYRANDGVGTAGHVEYLYRSHDTHVMYADGSYIGPLFVNAVHGKCLLILKTAYVREPDNKYYITCRLDTFIQLKNVGVELVAKTFQPLVGKTADHNFRETAAFMAMVSRSAERDPEILHRLAGKLTKVDEETRRQLCDLADETAMAALDREGARAAVPPGNPRKTVMKTSATNGR